MKTKFRGLALTAILLSSTSMTFADDAASSAVGDLPGYGEDAYFDEDAAYAESSYVAPASHQNTASTRPAARRAAPQYQTAQYRSPRYAPVAANQLQPASFQHGYGPNCDVSCGCEGGCDGGCDSGCHSGGYGSSCGLGGCLKFGDIFNCGCETWAQVEFLAWFTPDRKSPAYVTTSDPNTFPDVGLAGSNTQVVFGDDIEGEFTAGIRLDYGAWVSENIGVGGRFWALAESNDSYFGASDGLDMSLGRPFFDSSVGQNASLLVAFDGQFSGAVAADNSLDVWGAEAYARTKFSCTKSCRLDFIGGYSHFEIDDTLAISSTTVSDTTARTRTFADYFDAKNRFDGGQVGFEMVMTRGRWMARSLTKVHLGNNQQTVRIAGFNTDQTPPAGTVTNSGGLLARGNQGVYERDVFAFVPEVNFKLAYCLHKNMRLSVGYSFLYFDNVVMTGDVVDPIVNGTDVIAGVLGNQPSFTFNDSNLWVQGLDLGVVIDF